MTARTLNRRWGAVKIDLSVRKTLKYSLNLRSGLQWIRNKNYSGVSNRKKMRSHSYKRRFMKGLGVLLFSLLLVAIIFAFFELVEQISKRP